MRNHHTDRDMAVPLQKSQEVTVEGGGGAMDRVRKILSSPISGRKRPAASTQPPALTSSSPAAGTSRYFGVPLEELTLREGVIVPRLVTDVALYIRKHGLDQEGVFRVSGNSKAVERLRQAYERPASGGGRHSAVVDLEALGEDVMAVAGLLKLFLRELPGGVVSEAVTTQFVQVQQDYSRDHDECLRRHRRLIDSLPEANHALLKFLAHFLVYVSRHEETNKMSPMALGIVFGPNIFRCSSGIQGLKEQGVTNHIVLKFISEYDRLFLQPGEVSPYVAKTYTPPADGISQNGNSKVAPPRPPPPMLANSEVAPAPASAPQVVPKRPAPPVPGTPPSPVPSPRKYKRPSFDEEDGSGAARRNVLELTPRYSDDEISAIDTARSASPFALEAETPRSVLDSGATTPLLNTMNAEVVEKTIHSVVTAHLFGDEDDMRSSSGPVPAPRYHKSGRSAVASDDADSPGDSSDDARRGLSVKQRIQQMETSDPGSSSSPESAGAPKPRKQRPKSKAFEMFEEKGIIIGMASDSGKSLSKNADSDSGHTEDQSETEITGMDSPSPGQSRPVPKPRSPRKQRRGGGSGGELSPEENEAVPRLSSATSQDSVLSSDDSGFGSIQRTQNTLIGFKRAPGPKNRRTPTRISLKRGEDGSSPPLRDGGALDYIEEDLEEMNGQYGSQEDDDEEADVNHNNEHKPSFAFLNMHHNGNGSSSSGGGESADRSPTGGRKPYVPPLDLSILHEHGDGSEPIPAVQGPSVSLHKANALQQQQDDAAMVSPRLTKLKSNKPNCTDSYEEAPLSPSAFRIPFAPSSAPPDYDIPPSPPTDQHAPFIANASLSREDNLIKQYTKRIQLHKRKIKAFEEAFERERGYKASKSDKTADPETKKHMLELSKARSEYKKFRADLEAEHAALTEQQTAGYNTATDIIINQVVSSGAGTTTSQSAPALISGGEAAPPAQDSMADTLCELLDKLSNKRRDGGRPEDLMLMNREQVQDEKLSVQKALLQFEGIHGRPKSKSEKELMRPLYDRYRNIKRMLAKVGSSGAGDKAELAAVPEDQTMEFPSPSTVTSAKSSSSLRDAPPRGASGATSSSSSPSTMSGTSSEDDFLVTRLMRETVDRGGGGDDHPPLDLSPDKFSRNLHELSLSELQEELNTVRNEKKRLRRVIKEYEDKFLQATGRRVQKDDRGPMEMEYNQYRQTKSRLNLINALITKKDPVAIP